MDYKKRQGSFNSHRKPKRRYTISSANNIPKLMDVYTHQSGNSYWKNDYSTPPPPIPIAYPQIPTPTYGMYSGQWIYSSNWSSQQFPPLPQDNDQPPPPPPPPSPEHSGSLQNIPRMSRRAKKRQSTASLCKRQKSAIKEWNENEAQSNLPIIKIKFPDPHIDGDVVKKLHPQINMVHFQESCTPRYCFARLNPNADIDAVIEEVSKIKFGDGFLSAERKHESIHTTGIAEQPSSNKENSQNVENHDEHENENLERNGEEIPEPTEKSNECEIGNILDFSIDKVKEEPVVNVKQEPLEKQDENENNNHDDEDKEEDLENSQFKITEFLRNATWDMESRSEDEKPILGSIQVTNNWKDEHDIQMILNNSR